MAVCSPCLCHCPVWTSLLRLILWTSSGSSPSACRTSASVTVNLYLKKRGYLPGNKLLSRWVILLMLLCAWGSLCNSGQACMFGCPGLLDWHCRLHRQHRRTAAAQDLSARLTLRRRAHNSWSGTATCSASTISFRGAGSTSRLSCQAQCFPVSMATSSAGTADACSQWSNWCDMACLLLGHWQVCSAQQAPTASRSQTALCSLNATAHACVCGCGVQPLTEMVWTYSRQRRAGCNPL